MILENIFQFVSAICGSKLIFSHRRFCSGRKSIWSFYLPSKIDFVFFVFSETWKSIWSSYLLSKWALFRHGSRDVANSAKPWLNIRVEEAFLTPLDRKAQICAPKRLPKALRFIVFAWSSQPWGALGEKASFWKANSRSILIFSFMQKCKIKKHFSKVNRSSILIFQKENRSEKRSIWKENSCSKLKNQISKLI